MLTEVINGGLAEGVVALIIAIAGGIFIAGQVKANAARNQEDIDDIKEMLRAFEEGMRNTLTNSIQDMKDLIDSNKVHQKESLEREITHIKDLISISSNETREDIKRLEIRQSESNRARERLALVEASLRSLHKRLDIEPPLRIDGNE